MVLVSTIDLHLMGYDMKKIIKVERARKKLEKFKYSDKKGKCPICIKKFNACKHTEEQAKDKLYKEWISAVFAVNK
jgi:hypothetical protein